MLLFIFAAAIVYFLILELRYVGNSKTESDILATTEYKTVIETYPGGDTYRLYSDGTKELVYTNPI